MTFFLMAEGQPMNNVFEGTAPTHFHEQKVQESIQEPNRICLLDAAAFPHKRDLSRPLTGQESNRAGQQSHGPGLRDLPASLAYEVAVTMPTFWAASFFAW